MLKKSASFVLASFRGSTYSEYASPLRLLRPRWTAILNILCADDSHLTRWIIDLQEPST
jgi:hypothetical protein